MGLVDLRGYISIVYTHILATSSLRQSTVSELQGLLIHYRKMRIGTHKKNERGKISIFQREETLIQKQLLKIRGTF